MDTNIKKRAVIYCRVSTKEQADEGGSLATQEKLCKEYAIKNSYEVAEIFIEQGESAKNAERTQLKKLLNYCTGKKNSIQVVIAYKIDRVARNIDDYRQIRLLLNRYGVELKSTTEYFEDTPAGRFMENIIANVAQFDNDVRTERSVNGSRDAMRDGRYVWSAPYGYSNAKVAGKSTIVQNKFAPIIQKVFEEIAKDQYPVDTIRHRLFPEGLASRTGDILTKSHYYKLLNNETYAGWIIKFGERHKGTFESIISDELFEQVQRILKRRSHRSGAYLRENPDFPLRRFVYHPNGMKITGAWSQGRRKKYAYYRFIGIPGADYKKIAFEDIYVKFVNRHAIASKHFSYLRKALKEALDVACEKDVKEADTLKAIIKSLNDKQTALIEKNAKGVIGDSVLRRQLEQIEYNLTKAHADLYALPEKPEDIGELLDFTREYLETPGSIWAKASFQLKVKLQWFEFPSGIILVNDEFRTAEIASIFKAKDIFLPKLSSNVRSDGHNYEHTRNTNFPISLETAQQLRQELTRLAAILKGSPP